ncbi:iron-containing alcohol dehydrogenase [Agarivorans sp. QJM3NY_29]|uniref:iron-containing alcohol dehydrogenase n=1 Tax=unclassified Agarivorans TaxID=2636026 RepID=UPI003D7E2A4D
MAIFFNLPKQSLLGRGALNDLVGLLKTKNFSKALLVTDKGLVECGLVKQVTQLFEANQLDYVVYDKVQPNPSIQQVMAGKDVYLSHGCDYVIGLGGGSAIDAAKAINVVVHNPGSIADYVVGGRPISQPLAPLVAITTTAGTASEATLFSIVTDIEKKLKFMIADPIVMADIAVVDPELMLGLPKMTTACTGMDALTHAVEAYVSNSANPLTDANALAAINIIFEWLPIASQQGGDIEAREMMAYGQYLAGLAFNTAGVGLVHSMAHQMGATHDLAHGLCNAILLPYVCEYNASHSDSTQFKLAKLAHQLGFAKGSESLETACNIFIREVLFLSEQCGVPRNFAEYQFSEADIQQWLAPALSDPCTSFNPVIPSASDVLGLYKKVI